MLKKLSKTYTSEELCSSSKTLLALYQEINFLKKLFVISIKNLK